MNQRLLVVQDFHGSKSSQLANDPHQSIQTFMNECLYQRSLLTYQDDLSLQTIVLH